MIYVYREERRAREIRNSFSIVDDKGNGLEFWYSAYPEDLKEQYPDLFSNPTGGVERHTTRPMGYDTESSRRETCFILGSPCYHDGSGLWAEQYIPYRDDKEMIFRMLEKDHKEHFAEAVFKDKVEPQ